MDMTISDVKGGPYGNMLSRKEDRSSCIAASGPVIKRRACYTQKNLSSETGHFLSYGSIHDLSLKNDKSKEMSKASVAYDASKNVFTSPKVILDEVTDNKLVREETSLTARSPFSSHGIKTSDLCQRKASDIAKEKHREECHTKNDLHISGFKEANSAVHVCLGQLHKKLKECSSGLTDSSCARNDIEEIQNEAAYDCNNSELQENQTEFKENGEFSLENRTIHSIIDDVSCQKIDSTEHPPSSSNVSPMSQSPCSGSPMNGILSRCSINDEKSPILGKYVVGEKDDMPDEVSKEDSRKSQSRLVSSKGSDECMGTEIDDNRKFQPRDTIKGRATNEQADKQFNQVPSQPNSECEASAEIEADVKVCDICGDSGLEELLAFCSRCSDGAEHTYCMQVRLDTVPESEWVCEECRLKEAQNQMIGKFESQLEAIEAVCSSENSQSIESTSKSLPGVENKAVDLGTTKDNKELDKLILSKRTEEKFDVTKEKISEACGASTGTTVSRKPTLVVCDNTINKSDLVKVKLPALVTSCCQSEGISRPGANAQSSSYSNSYKLQTHFELTKGSLSKSVSFNKSKVPKVKQLLENIPHKQKMTREYSLSSMRKGGPSQAITKSASFRSESSGFSNVSTVGDVQLPNPPPCEDLRDVKQVKEKSMTDKRLFMSDRPFTSLSVAATSVSSVKVAPKVLQYEATPEVMLDPSKLSNNRGSKEATKFAKELKQLPISPISQTSGSTSSVRSCKNEDQKPLHHGAELIHKDDKTKDHTFLSNIKQAASVDNRLARCQRCNESGHSTQFCAVDRLHMSAMKPSLKRNSKDVDYRSSKWKDAVDVFTLESGTKRTARSPDQSMEVSMSSADVHSEATSKDFPSSLISSRNLAFMEHASVAQDFSNTANAIHVKQKVEDRKKYTFLPRKVTPLDFADDLNMQPVIQTLPDRVSMPLHLLRASVIPELDCIWEGVFEVLKIAKPPAFLDGIQAHLSSYVSPKALELVKKFPCKVQLEEVPRLSAWPFQSHENSPKEDNIALFFFAKDTESYEKYYLNLLEDMLKNDLALIGNIDAVELLILPSNLLPANSQCWNKLFYLWGVFRGRNISCFTDLPDLEKKPSVSSLNLEPTVQDQSIPDFSGLCSSYEIYDENSQELSRFDKFPKAKAIISSSCSNIQDVPTSGNKDRILNIKQIPPVQNLHYAVCGDKVLTEQTSCSCSASCPYTNVSQLPNVPVAYPEPKLQIDIEQLPLEMENDLTDLGKLAGDSEGSKDSEHHANASSTSISNCEEPVFLVLFNCQQGNARNVQKIKQKEKFITSEAVPDDQVSDAIKLDDLSWESRHNKKRRLPSSAETIIKPTADRMLWKDEASCTSMNDTELKKMRLDNGGHAACSSREETLSSGLPSKIHPLPSGCLNDGIGCDTMCESSKNAERFFPIDLGTATSTKADNLIYVLSSDNEDSPESMAPDLELALWGKKRPPKTDSSPWLSPNVGIKRNPDKPLAPPAVDDGDDMLASLSLSLAFPATEKPRSDKPMTQDEQLLSDKPCINTSLLLFGGYTDTYQEPVLFATSIRDNIAYGKDSASVEEIRAAAEIANAAKFIDKLPKGLDTMVGEHGTQLSGGQKQRVAIARAILKDPRILLLDEATSALDAESERIVQEALDRIMANRTTVIVAHRLSTIRNADTIAVVHQGSIVEKGSHTELLKNPNGAYSQLIQLQEVNRDEDIKSGPRLDKSDVWNGSARSSGKILSFHHSISHGSSGRHSDRHSFQLPVGLHVGVDVQDSTYEKVDPKIPTEDSKEVPLRRLAYLNKPEIPVLILGSVAAIANGVMFPMFALLLSNVINAFYQPPQKLKRDSNFWSLLFLVFGGVALFSLPARSYFFGIAGSKLIRRIRLMTFQKVVNMEIEWFDDPKNSSGAIGARLSADAATVRSLVGDALGLIVENITTLVAGLLIAFIANWQLSLIILVLLPLLGLNGYIQMKFLKGFGKDAKIMYEEASQVANDAVGSIRTVASFSAEEKVMEIYKQKCEGPTRKGIRLGIISGAGFGFSIFFLFCVYAAGFYAGARLVDSGKTTFGKVFRVFLALAMAAIGISQSSSLAPDSSKARSASASVFAILDRKSKIDPSNDSGMILETLKGNIELCHVSFRYPMRPDIQIFQDLSLTVHSGKTVALVGESGSGKSTIISLLQRFYNPDSGVILLDGIDIQKLQLRWLRQKMGLVSQEPTLFNETIRSNIAYGKEGMATEAEIIAAAELANAHKFISGLHKGYDTLVGERGLQLSGGQKQRIAIARAIVKDPKILLLDEATSALDAESERVVQDALDHVMVDRTTIIVAHRLSTIRGANVIAVVKNGVIVEKGNHETLISIKDGAYASLVALHLSSGS